LGGQIFKSREKKRDEVGKFLLAGKKRQEMWAKIFLPAKLSFFWR
jgi:hypothetical protein